MYTFLTGPMLWLSFAVFLIGIAVRVVRYIKGLDWQLDRVSYGYFTSYGVIGAIKSVLHWIVPFGSRSWRVKPGFTLLFFFFHIGLVIVPIFLFAHVLIVKERFGLSWPTLPGSAADFLTLAAIAAGLFILVRRLALPEVRIITTPQDLFIMALSLAPLLTGYMAAHVGPDHDAWTIAHIICGEAMLIAIPFTKLSHVVLFFMSRIQIGMDFGIKRGGRKGSGIVW